MRVEDSRPGSSFEDEYRVLPVMKLGIWATSPWGNRVSRLSQAPTKAKMWKECLAKEPRA